MNEETTLSISEASHMLGVSEVTLRQWTDEGRVKAFITPGGHRRYTIANLKKFMGPHQKPQGIKDLATRLEDTAPVHREIAASYFHQSALFNRLDGDSQQYFAALGRRFLNLIIKYVSEPLKQEENLKAVKEAGYGFGEMAARQGLSLTETMQAFIQHRDPIINVTTDMMKKHEGVNRRIIESISLVNHALDEALVSLVTAHQQFLKLSADGLEENKQ
jgi:excisionase family DNA binding protein